MKQKPLARTVSAWCPGGLTAQKDRSLFFIKSSDLKVEFKEAPKVDLEIV